MTTPPDAQQPTIDLPLESREALERALDERTRPTVEDAARIATLEGLDLRQAVYRASDALAVFDDVLMQLHDDSFQLDEALAGMDESALASDHGWSEVLHLLAGLPEDADELRAVGLVKYRRYLRNRLEALEGRQKALHAERAATPDAAPTPAALEVPELPDSELVLDLELVPEEADAKADAETDAGADEDEDAANFGDFGQATVMHRSAAEAIAEEAAAGAAPGGAVSHEPAPARPQRLLRLRRGKPVALAVAGRAEVELWLGRSHFRLLLGDGPRLVSDFGDGGPLRNGRSLVGRSPDCEVVLDPRHDTVSRVHLEVEVEHGQLVAVTDLSSGGTYVRPELVPPRRTDAA